MTGRQQSSFLSSGVIAAWVFLSFVSLFAASLSRAADSEYTVEGVTEESPFISRQTVNGRTWTISGTMKIRYRFSSLMGEPIVRYESWHSIDSLKPDSPVTYTAPDGKTHAYRGDVNSEASVRAASDKVRVYAFEGGFRFKPIPGRGGNENFIYYSTVSDVTFRQREWGFNSTGSPVWDRFLHTAGALPGLIAGNMEQGRIDRDRAKDLWRGVVTNTAKSPRRYELDDVAVANVRVTGLNDVENAMEAILRKQAEAEKTAAGTTSAPTGIRAGGAGKTVSQKPQSSTGDAGGMPKWRGYAGPDKQTLRRNRQAINDALARNAELSRQNRDGATARSGASRPGTAFNVGDTPPAGQTTTAAGKTFSPKPARRSQAAPARKPATQPRVGGGTYVDGDWEAVGRDRDAVGAAVGNFAGGRDGFDMQKIRDNPDAFADALGDALENSTTRALGDITGVDRERLRNMTAEALGTGSTPEKARVPVRADALKQSLRTGRKKEEEARLRLVQTRVNAIKTREEQARVAAAEKKKREERERAAAAERARAAAAPRRTQPAPRVQARNTPRPKPPPIQSVAKRCPVCRASVQGSAAENFHQTPSGNGMSWCDGKKIMGVPKF